MLASLPVLHAKLVVCTRLYLHEHMHLTASIKNKKKVCTYEKGALNNPSLRYYDSGFRSCQFQCAHANTIMSLPSDVDLLLVDINTHFYMSVNWKDQLKEFCDIVVDVSYKMILAHDETRWLSPLRIRFIH